MLALGKRSHTKRSKTRSPVIKLQTRHRIQPSTAVLLVRWAPCSVIAPALQIQACCLIVAACSQDQKMPFNLKLLQNCLSPPNMSCHLSFLRGKEFPEIIFDLTTQRSHNSEMSTEKPSTLRILRPTPDPPMEWTRQNYKEKKKAEKRQKGVAFFCQYFPPGPPPATLGRKGCLTKSLSKTLVLSFGFSLSYLRNCLFLGSLCLIW